MGVKVGVVGADTLQTPEEEEKKTVRLQNHLKFQPLANIFFTRKR